MSLGTFWFCLVGGMLAAYVVLDGYDIGTGILHLFVARTDAESARLITSDIDERDRPFIVSGERTSPRTRQKSGR